MSMVGGYQTSGDVLKQVSHRGAIRLPVKMIKGKCKRNLLGQFAVQRESLVDLDERNVASTRWFYRLTWDGGNVAYHDYVKTVLSNDEFFNIFGSNPSAEYVGDVMEFWLGMFELAVQFPMLFKGWGGDPAACLFGIEDSFWLFTNSCRPATTSNTKRSRSKKAHVPQVEVQEEEEGDFMPTAEEAPTEPCDDEEMEDEEKPCDEGPNVNPGESNAKFKETEKDDVDDFLRQEQKEERKAASEEAKGATSGVRDARDYPAWMRRIKFGSQVLPQEPCLVGDAQTELIHIIILMIANNLGTFLGRHHSLFCGDIGKLASAHNDKAQERFDLDPKIPFLGVDNNGELIEPNDEQLEQHYQDWMNKKTKWLLVGASPATMGSIHTCGRIVPTSDDFKE
eukprot:s1825_g1.t1